MADSPAPDESGEDIEVLLFLLHLFCSNKRLCEAVIAHVVVLAIPQKSAGYRPNRFEKLTEHNSMEWGPH